MNTPIDYRRQNYRPPERADALQDDAVPTSALAHRRDPSVVTPSQPPTRTARGVAWVRPTELATVTAPMVGRGVDLQAELIRRARRTPVTASRVVRQRLTHSPSPTPPVNRTEGLSL
ncbi:hypothetical protein [Nocardioides campestrisoli]|uniref:hypothetical protein n=1 Tax=Nocardioides campestrisoli TaxID=2736757 RepID=UPI00163DD7C5|nr:hypothetical protein [Nocardioides campestrisoli]